MKQRQIGPCGLVPVPIDLVGVPADDGSSLLPLLQIPYPQGTLKATAHSYTPIGRRGHRSNIAAMADELRLDCAGGQVPNTDGLVLRARRRAASPHCHGANRASVAFQDPLAAPAKERPDSQHTSLISRDYLHRTRFRFAAFKVCTKIPRQYME
jgi:hypothetical protein